MLFGAVSDYHAERWRNYFAFTATLFPLEEEGVQEFYPTNIVCSQFNGFVLVELYGASNHYEGLKLRKKRDNGDIKTVFDPFSLGINKPVMILDGGENEISNICFGQSDDPEGGLLRFPYLSQLKAKFAILGSTGALVDFTATFESCLFEKCAFLWNAEDIYRCKYAPILLLHMSGISKAKLDRFYDRIFGNNEVHDNRKYHRVRGTLHGDALETPAIVGSQLQNLYLNSHTHETAIGEFLNNNPDILHKTMGIVGHVYEPHLLWKQDDGSVKETAINPDFMVKRQDGLYDFLELKLARVDRNSITKSERSRRRFIDYVQEAIAQVANYLFYFSFVDNQIYANEKYGIRVENPNITIVIGSWENVNRQEVQEAMRAHHLGFYP